MAEFRHFIIDSYMRWHMNEEAKKVRDEGYKFTETQAAIDLMIAQYHGTEKPHRYYAKRWGWHKSSVTRKLPELRKTIEEWKDLTGNSLRKRVNQSRTKSEPEFADSSPKTDASEPLLNQVRTRFKKIEDINLNTKNINNLKNLNLSCHFADAKVTPRMVMDEWNTFAKSHGFKQVRKLTGKRKEWYRLRGREFMDNRTELYELILSEPFLCGRIPVDDRRKPWSVTLDYLTRNDHNMTKVLEGGPWPQPQPKNKKMQQPETYQPRPTYTPPRNGDTSRLSDLYGFLDEPQA